MNRRPLVRVIDLVFLGVVVGFLAGGWALYFAHETAATLIEAWQARPAAYGEDS